MNINSLKEEVDQSLKAYFNKEDMNKIVEQQIKDFIEGV